MVAPQARIGPRRINFIPARKAFEDGVFSVHGETLDAQIWVEPDIPAGGLQTAAEFGVFGRAQFLVVVANGENGAAARNVAGRHVSGVALEGCRGARKQMTAAPALHGIAGV